MTRSSTVLFVLVLFGLFPTSTIAQDLPVHSDSLSLSLDQAISRAVQASEEIQLARTQVDFAEAQIRAARAEALPQINGNAGYTRTLASAFDTGGGGFTLPDSLQFNPNPNATLEERVRYLEDRTPIAALGSLGALFSDLPFGQENAYAFTISGSQLLYSGGRVSAAMRIARNLRDAAQYTLQEDLADLELQIRSAYYQAQFAQELITISEAAIERAQRFLNEEQLRRRAGQASDLDVLRAEVELENLRPQLVQANNTAELAMLNLKRLVNIPVDQPVKLTTPLAPPSPEERAQVALDPEVAIAQRAAIRAAEEQVAILKDNIRIARSAFLPSASLNTSYGRQLFPQTLFGFNEEWRKDWTIGVSLQVPIFDGFRRSAAVQQARVELRQAELQRDMLKEGIELEYQQALGERQRALAQVDASARTVEQAERVYNLTELQYDEGQATQLEVFSAQLALLQARTNYAQALADYYEASASTNRALGLISPTVRAATLGSTSLIDATPAPSTGGATSD